MSQKLGFFVINNRVGGGGMVATENAIRNLQQYGYEIVLFVEEKCKGNVHRIDVGGADIVPVGKLSTDAGATNLVKAINELNIDVFITHCHYYLPVIQLFPRIKSDTSAKVVLSEHHYHFIPLYEKREKLYLERERYLKSADLITVIEKTSFWMWKVGGYPVVLLPNTYFPSDTDKSLSVGEKKKQVVLCGRFVDFKQMPLGVAAFAHAARNHPDWELTVLGAGADLEKSKALARKLGIADRVTTIGWTQDAASYFRDASIHILPSYTEPFGLVTLDARNASIPTVMFDLPSNPLVEDGLNGFRVPCGDVCAFSDRLERLIKDEDLRATMGVQARKALLSGPNMPLETIKVWEELLCFVSGRPSKDESLRQTHFEPQFDVASDLGAMVFDVNSAISWYAARRPKVVAKPKVPLLKSLKNWKLWPRHVAKIYSTARKHIDKKLGELAYFVGSRLFAQDQIMVWDSNGVAKFDDVLSHGLFDAHGRKVTVATPRPGSKMTLALWYALGRARFLITNTNTRHTLQVKKSKHSRTQVINIWHGSGFFKHFGTDENGIGLLEFNRKFGAVDNVLCSSEQSVSAYSRIFGLPETQVLPFGSLRTDLLVNANSREQIVARFYEKHPELKGKKIYVFAPTWRGVPFQTKTAHFRPKLDMLKVAERLNDDEILVVKNHQLVAWNRKRDKHACNIAYADGKVINGDAFDTMELTAVCDAFITDFSSAYFDALVLNKPVLFYAEDAASYLANWKIYDAYEDYIPGELIDQPDAGAFVDAIRNSHQFTGGEKYRRIKERHVSANDGRVAERLSAYLHENWS